MTRHLNKLRLALAGWLAPPSYRLVPVHPSPRIMTLGLEEFSRIRVVRYY